MEVYSRGASKILLVVGDFPVKIFLLVSYLFCATRTRNTMFFKGKANFHQLMATSSFLGL